jgi:two-component system phosphate regulon response regulator PhoB
VWLELGSAGVWSWLRRLLSGQASVRPSSPDRAEHGFQLDTRARGLLIDGEPVPLSSLEYSMLGYLLERAGQVVTRDTLLQEVWQQPYSGSNVVDALVRQVRKKLGPYAAALETVRGHGYRVAVGGRGLTRALGLD